MLSGLAGGVGREAWHAGVLFMMDARAIFDAIRNRSGDTEFYMPLPAGYELGHTKYVIVFGTVMSGLGKGIFSSSLAKCLQDKGLHVTPVKLEGYLNIDSGTLNPFRHGEVFVLDDGTECDAAQFLYQRPDLPTRPGA